MGYHAHLEAGRPSCRTLPRRRRPTPEARGRLGKFGIRKGDGVEEIFEAGDAFIIEPGQTSIIFAGGEIVVFTPTEEAKQQTAMMMPNIMKLAQDRGIELPG